MSFTVNVDEGKSIINHTNVFVSRKIAFDNDCAYLRYREE